MIRSHRIFIVLIIALALAACSGAAGQTANESTPASGPATPASIQMAWFHEYSVSWFHVAVTNGYFADHGVDVELLQGGFNDSGYIDPVVQVVNGTADFGLTNTSALIQARADGQPIVAVAALLQRNPLALISLAENNIQRPQDLVGKRVSVAEGGAMQLYDTLLASQGIDPASITTLPRTEFGIEPLLNGDVDVLAAWVINEAVAIREAGYEPSIILLSDYGIDTYESVLFTTQEMVDQHPEVVEGVLRGLMEGMEATIADPAAAVDITLTYNAELDREAQLRRLEATIPLMTPGGQLGMMDPKIWDDTQQILLDQGVLSSPIDISTVFTLDFLNRIYGN